MVRSSLSVACVAAALFLSGCGAQPVSPAVQTNINKGVAATGTVLPSSNANDIVCTQEYAPVCGKFQVKCVTTPCEPLDKTYSNRCEAEKERATNIREGACPMN